MIVFILCLFLLSDSKSLVSGNLTPRRSSSPFSMLMRLKGGVQSTSQAGPSGPSGWYVTLQPPVICLTIPTNKSRTSDQFVRVGAHKCLPIEQQKVTSKRFIRLKLSGTCSPEQPPLVLYYLPVYDIHVSGAIRQCIFYFYMYFIRC